MSQNTADILSYVVAPACALPPMLVIAGEAANSVSKMFISPILQATAFGVSAVGMSAVIVGALSSMTDMVRGKIEPYVKED